MGIGTIWLAATPIHMGRIGLGQHPIETPVGVVTVDMRNPNTVTVTSLESRRTRTGVSVEIDGVGTVTGDITHGDNCFFIVDSSPILVTSANIRQLTEVTIAVREAVLARDVGCENGMPIDHAIFHGPAETPEGHSRNFVLCPDDAYDRSPCGMGSTARLACLAAEGRLSEGEETVQKSVIGSTYRLSWRKGPNGDVIPLITGKAYVMAESKLSFLPGDPIRQGIALCLLPDVSCREFSAFETDRDPP